MEESPQGDITGLEIYINRFSELSDGAKEKIRRFMGRLVPGGEVTIGPVPEQSSKRAPLDATEELVLFGEAGQSKPTNP